MRSRFITATSAILAACAHSAATPASQSEMESARAGVAAQHQAWRDAIIAGDSGALASLFAEDGMLLGVDGSVVKGRSQIEGVLRDTLRRSKYLSGGFAIEQLDLQGPLAT
jgi:ketosteroid isomerase-like protein